MAIYARFDVSFPDDPKVVDAGCLAELAYVRCVLRGREHLTDGVIDRRVVSRWLAGIKGKPETHMAALVAAGLLDEHEQGWRIPEPAWRRWNPLKSEVEEKQAAEAERKRVAREAKSAKRPAGQTADGDRNPDLSEVRPGQPETKEEPKEETETEPCGGGVSAEVQAEAEARIRRRRSQGEDIGPGLVALILADVERDLGYLAPTSPRWNEGCEMCDGVTWVWSDELDGMVGCPACRPEVGSGRGGEGSWLNSPRNRR